MVICFCSLRRIVFVIRNGLRWRDAPRDYGPHMTIYNRFVRWSQSWDFAPFWKVWNAGTNFGQMVRRRAAHNAGSRCGAIS